MPRDSKSHADRYFGDLTAKYTFDTNWSGNLLYQTVSDTDYFADFNNNSPETANRVFLERYARVTFHNANCDFNNFLLQLKDFSKNFFKICIMHRNIPVNCFTNAD